MDQLDKIDTVYDQKKSVAEWFRPSVRLFAVLWCCDMVNMCAYAHAFNHYFFKK